MSTGARIEATIKPPSALSAAERAAWSACLAGTPHLQRAFFAPAFAEAAERAGFDARVAVLYEGSLPVAFLPFQHDGSWQRWAGLAERIGGALSDHAGLIARPDFRIDPARLLRLARLGVMFIDHLTEGQEQFGLAPGILRPGHVIELGQGQSAYFSWLARTNKSFLQDTERRMRRLEKEFGSIQFGITARPAWDEVEAMLDAKRAQYDRTGVDDVFADARRMGLVKALVKSPDPECQPLLNSLAAGGRVLARHLGLTHAGTLSYWFPVYDPAAQKVSPGRMLLWQTIAAADQHGIRMIDRGEGDSQAKRDFSTRTQWFGQVNWQAGGWRAAFARAAQAAAWRLGK